MGNLHSNMAEWMQNSTHDSFIVNRTTFEKMQGLATGSTATPQMSPSVQADTNLNAATAWKNFSSDHER